MQRFQRVHTRVRRRHGRSYTILPARKATPPSLAVPAESPAPSTPTSSPEKALPAFCLYAAPLPDTSRDGTVRRLSLWAGFFTQRGVSQACLRDRRPVTSSCHSSSRLSGGPR